MTSRKGHNYLGKAFVNEQGLKGIVVDIVIKFEDR